MRFKGYALLSFCCFLFLGDVQAQQSRMWEVSGNGMKKPSYIFGTIHLRSNDIFSWNDSTYWAIRNTDYSMFEIDMSEYAEQDDYSSFYGYGFGYREAHKQVFEKYIKHTPIDTLVARQISRTKRMRENRASMARNDSNARLLFVDMFLESYAQNLGKEVKGIERVKEQIFLQQTIDKAQYKSAIDRMFAEDYDNEINVDFYTKILRNNNIENLCAYVDSTQEKFDRELLEMHQDIFEVRNLKMFIRTRKRILDSSIFIAVGTGHFCGEFGLLNLLRKDGFTLRPVDLNSSYKEDVEWHSVSQNNFSLEVPRDVDSLKNGDWDAEYVNFGEEYMYPDSFYNVHVSPRGMIYFIFSDEDLSDDTETFDDYEDAIGDAVEAVEVYERRIGNRRWNRLNKKMSRVRGKLYSSKKRKSSSNFSRYRKSKKDDVMEEMLEAIAEAEVALDESESVCDTCYSTFQERLQEAQEEMSDEMEDYEEMQDSLSKEVIRDTISIPYQDSTLKLYRTQGENLTIRAKYIDQNGEDFWLNISGDEGILEDKNYWRIFSSFKFKKKMGGRTNNPDDVEKPD